MRSAFKLATTFIICGALAACGAGISSADTATVSGRTGDIVPPPPPPPVSPYTTTKPVVANRDGTISRQAITVDVTKDTQVFQVFEPTKLKVGEHYPLVLHGHGYGGKRETTAADGSFIKRLRDAGYYVISIDERGFGETTGTVRVMDPEFEGQNLIAILDWVETNLEGLRRTTSDGKMVVGSYGGSYGGMYQFLLMGADPKQRLHIIAPDITPNDLTQSLNLNNVVKSGYGLVLVGGGEASPRQSGPRQDPVIEEMLLNAVATNSFDASANNFFKYHSVSYFCDGKTAGPQTFRFATADKLTVPPTAFPKVDALITQGFRDSLFNFNQAFQNYQCLKARGGDVRLLTHESGHILTVSLSSVPPSGGLVSSPAPIPSQNLEGPLDPFYAAVNFPNFQDAAGVRNCGSVVLNDAQFAWFEEKLQGKTGLGLLDAAMKQVGANSVCLSLGKDDAIVVPSVIPGGTTQDIVATTPQFNAVLGVGGAMLGNGAREALLATQVIPVPADAVAIAGIPTMNIKLTGLSGQELAACPTPLNIPGCDPILFLGIGLQKKGTTRWDLIDDQLTPIRSFGDHGTVAAPWTMSGIAERLASGDKIALLIYGFHAQYPVTWSRDVFVPALNITGTINLPFLKAGDISNTLTVAPPPPPPASGGTLCAPGSVPGIGGQCSPVDPTAGGAPSVPTSPPSGIPPPPSGGGTPKPLTTLQSSGCAQKPPAPFDAACTTAPPGGL